MRTPPRRKPFLENSGFDRAYERRAAMTPSRNPEVTYRRTQPYACTGSPSGSRESSEGGDASLASNRRRRPEGKGGAASYHG